MDRERGGPARRRGSGIRARVAILLALLLIGVAVAAAGFLLPPALAEVPNDPLPADSTVTLGPLDLDGSTVVASVSVTAGWTRIGTGPFLPDDRATLVSPDGAYRVELELASATPSNPRGRGHPRLPGEAAETLEGELESAAWSSESLVSGNEVRYTTVRSGADEVTVVIVDPPVGTPSAAGSSGSAQLVLVAAAPAAEAARYRTVTADLVSSATFAPDDPNRD